MPGAVAVATPTATVAKSESAGQPIVLINTAPKPGRPQPRLAPGGWFSRSFASAAGVIAAVLLLLIGIPTVMGLLACGGCLAVTDSALKDVAEQQQARERDRKAVADRAIAQTKIALQKHRVSGEVSTDATHTASFLEGVTDEVHGSIRTSGGVKQFGVYFHVATFGNERTWTVKLITVDGKQIYDSR